VNGVLDKLAAQIRPQEIVQGNRRKKSTSTQEEP
jgi:hypothetical protein